MRSTSAALTGREGSGLLRLRLSRSVSSLLHATLQPSPVTTLSSVFLFAVDGVSFTVLAFAVAVFALGVAGFFFIAGAPVAFALPFIFGIS